MNPPLTERISERIIIKITLAAGEPVNSVTITADYRLRINKFNPIN
jgi:hypothetical protein